MFLPPLWSRKVVNISESGRLEGYAHWGPAGSRSSVPSEASRAATTRTCRQGSSAGSQCSFCPPRMASMGRRRELWPPIASAAGGRRCAACCRQNSSRSLHASHLNLPTGGGLLLSPIGAGRETWLLDTEWNQEAGDADRGSQRRGESTSMRPWIHQQIPYRGPGGDASERSGSRCRQRTGRTYRTRGPIEVD